MCSSSMAVCVCVCVYKVEPKGNENYLSSRIVKSILLLCKSVLCEKQEKLYFIP